MENLGCLLELFESEAMILKNSFLISVGVILVGVGVGMAGFLLCEGVKRAFLLSLFS